MITTCNLFAETRTLCSVLSQSCFISLSRQETICNNRSKLFHVLTFCTQQSALHNHTIRLFYELIRIIKNALLHWCLFLSAKFICLLFFFIGGLHLSCVPLLIVFLSRRADFGDEKNCLMIINLIALQLLVFMQL